MSLRDDLASVKMDQTRDYREQESNSEPAQQNNNTTAEDNTSSAEGDSSRKSISNPFKGNDGGLTTGILGNKKILLIGGGALVILIVVLVIVFSSRSSPEDEGASFLTDLEEVAPFEYTLEERDTLRINGYTADDIERYQAEERDPFSLVEEAEQKRKALLEEEMKPLLDGASPKYKELESMTWLGTGTMSSAILNNAEGSYEERYGTYNCDYTKVEARGAQLFVKLTLKEFNNQAIFMTMNPTRYNELDKSGNIVVVIEYNKYADGSILVTNVQEKDIEN